MTVNDDMKKSIQNMGCCRGCLSVGALFVLIAGIAFWVNCLRTNAELAGYRGLITHGDETESEFVNRVTGWMEAERYAVDITALQPIVGYRNHAVLFEATPGEIASLVARLGMEKYPHSGSTNPGGILTGGFFRDEELKACKHGEAYYQAAWELYKCCLTRKEVEQLIPISGAESEKGYELILLYCEALSSAILNVGDYRPRRKTAF